MDVSRVGKHARCGVAWHFICMVGSRFLSDCPVLWRSRILSRTKCGKFLSSSLRPQLSAKNLGSKVTNQKNRTISDEVRTPNFLLKERSLIGWKFLGEPGWSRLHTVIGHYRVAPCRCFNAKLTATPKIWEWFFYSHENESHYYRARFPLSLVLIVRVFRTGKWPFFFKWLPCNLYTKQHIVFVRNFVAVVFYLFSYGWIRKRVK